MSDTTIITKPDEQQSSLFGISIRAVIALGLSATICITHLAVTIAVAWDAIRTGNFDKVGTLTTVGEPLYSMGIAALGFYFGGQSLKKTP